MISRNQCEQQEINPEYSLEGLMLKLNFQYFGQLIQRADSLGKKKKKTLMLAKTGQEEKWATADEVVGQYHQLMSMDMSLSKLQEVVKVREAQHAAVYGVAKRWIQLSD